MRRVFSAPPLLKTPEGKPLVALECQRFEQTMHHRPQLASICESLLTRTPLSATALALFETGLAAEEALFAFADLNTNARARAFRVGCMLQWGLSQPWAASMPLDKLAVAWWQPFQLEKDQAHLRTGHIFVDFLEPLSLGTQPLGGRMPNTWCQTLFDGLEQTVPWTRYSSFKQEWCHPIFLAMGWLASELDAKTRRRWSHLAKQATDTMDEQEQTALLDTVLASSLPLAQKRQVAQVLPPALWLEDLRPLQLSGILDASEKTRFLQLGWNDNPSINKQLCQTYCPTIAAALAHIELCQWRTPSRLWKTVTALQIKNTTPDYGSVFGNDFAL